MNTILESTEKTFYYICQKLMIMIDGIISIFFYLIKNQNVKIVNGLY